MRTLRRLLPAVLVLAFAWGVPARAEDLPQPAAGAGPTTIDEVEEALTRLTERLERLFELAAKDPRFRVIETYTSYSIEDFGSSRRPVKAADLLDIVKDSEAPTALRDKAYEALTAREAIRFDPDLQMSRGQSGKPRNDWCRKHVTKLLYDKDQATREFAHRLLRGFYPDLRNAGVVRDYDPAKGTRTQWKRASAYWNKELR